MVLSQVLLYIKVPNPKASCPKRFVQDQLQRRWISISSSVLYSPMPIASASEIYDASSILLFTSTSFVDACGRGSDLAWGGSNVAKEDNHCLCWDHCRFYTAQVDDGFCVICANIDIKYQKGQRDKVLEKTITLRLLPAAIATQDSLRLLITLQWLGGLRHQWPHASLT
jgi:hypothetical protein